MPLAKPFACKFSNDKKQEMLSQRNTLLRQIKKYVDNNIYPTFVNVIDPTKDSFTQAISIKEVLDE